MNIRTAVAATLFACTMAVGSQAHAEGDEVTSKDDINPWKHCGLGAAIFDDNETAAALSNVIWDLGTTATTSAAISPGSCESKSVKVARFIDENYDVLAMETAIGEGEHLNAAMDLAGCAATGRDGVVSALRSDLKAVNSTADMAQDDKAYEFYNSLTGAGSCNAG